MGLTSAYQIPPLPVNQTVTITTGKYCCKFYMNFKLLFKETEYWFVYLSVCLSALVSRFSFHTN